jgi:hypothetical protein
VKGKTLTSRTSKSNTTKTADGGQLYVRGGVGAKDSYKIPAKAADAYFARGKSGKTMNPGIARGLEEATYLAMSPNDAKNAKLAKRMGEGAAGLTGKMNATTRSRGDKTRR